MIVFDEAALKKSLVKLGRFGQGTIALCAALRLWPSVSEADQVRLSAVLPSLQQIRKSVLSAVGAGVPSREALSQLVVFANETIEKLPDADSSTCDEDAYADCACAALLYSALAVAADGVENAGYALRTTYNAVDQFVLREMPGDEISEDVVLGHSVVQMELDRQLRDIEALIAEDSPSSRGKLIERAMGSPAIPNRAT